MDVTEPEVYLIARPEIDWQALYHYLYRVGGEQWGYKREHEAGIPDGEVLAEFAGKMCYRSWEPGLNPNVTRVREDRDAYLRNVLASGHGSVLEHVNYTFVLHNISRVVTHELVRHRPGTAVSQESMRFVRLADIPFWFPGWATQDSELMERCEELLLALEAHQQWMAGHFRLDDKGVPFHEKKHKTSFMRRFAPEGVATGMTWTANVRAIRHVLEVRTDPGAEEEIRLVVGKVGQIMREACPVLFGDFEDHLNGAWTPEHHKV